MGSERFESISIAGVCTHLPREKARELGIVAHLFVSTFGMFVLHRKPWEVAQCSRARADGRVGFMRPPLGTEHVTYGQTKESAISPL